MVKWDKELIIFLFQNHSPSSLKISGLHSGGTRMSDHKCIKVDFQIDLNLRGQAKVIGNN